MKIKNISDKLFPWEGIECPKDIVIEVGESVEVTEQEGQRLLALYWGKYLDLDVSEEDVVVSENKVEVFPVDTTATLTISANETVTNEVVTPTIEVTELKCSCGKIFRNRGGLSSHKKLSKNELCRT